MQGETQLMQLRSDYHQSFPQSAEIALDSCFFKDCSNISDGQYARTVIVLLSSEKNLRAGNLV